MTGDTRYTSSLCRKNICKCMLFIHKCLLTHIKGRMRGTEEGMERQEVKKSHSYLELVEISTESGYCNIICTGAIK